MNNSLVTRTGNLPVLSVAPGDVGAVMQTLQSLAASYRDVSIVNAHEATQRVAIREQARVLIEQFHAETDRYRINRTCKTTVQLEFIRTLNDVLCTKDMLDERHFQILKETMECVFADSNL